MAAQRRCAAALPALVAHAATQRCAASARVTTGVRMRAHPHSRAALSTAASAAAAASSPPPPPLVLYAHAARPGVALITMANPKKLNAWTPAMLLALRAALDDAAGDAAVRAVVLTGQDPYFCAGVSLADTLRPMHPRALRALLVESNTALFETFLAFPKPLLVACNGPAIGASVTSATLCDAVFASERATFSTPFAALGIPPEGCSSLVFPRRLGSAAAGRMLEQNWRPTAHEALAVGLVHRVTPHDALLPAALDEAQTWAAARRARVPAADPALSLCELRAVNAAESARLADAFLAPPFLAAQAAFAARKGRYALAATFWALRVTRPLWALLL